MIAQFFEKDGALTRTAQSVWAELSNHLAPLNTEQIKRATQKTDWEPEELRNGKTSVFITLPPNARGQYRAIMALVLNAHLNRLLDELPPKDAPPILLLLDEMPQLGHMRAIEQVIDLGRGYGLLLYGFAQRRQQIEESYGNPGDFLGTFEARLYMNPAPEDGSAEMISAAIGEEERIIGTQIERVRVAPVDELCGREYRDDIVVLSRGARPARLHKSFAFKDPELAQRLRSNQDADPTPQTPETP
jgi:type IV secretion system protein VirD4